MKGRFKAGKMYEIIDAIHLFRFRSDFLESSGCLILEKPSTRFFILYNHSGKICALVPGRGLIYFKVVLYIEEYFEEVKPGGSLVIH